MRVLRSSFYGDAYGEPTIIVVRDSDTKDTLESVRISTLQPGALVLHDLFEMEDGSIEAATRRAAERARKTFEQERHQALLFYWIVRSWRMLRSGGSLLSDKPAPLDVEPIRVVLEQLAEHPDNQNYGYLLPAIDGTVVMLRNGIVEEHQP